MSETGDGLDHLRIPFEKIKFGNKLEVQGYGTVFEGEFGDRRVALKQLNITNLANVKNKLLAEILTISRFRQHPNLVALLGFCDEKSNEIILVYEFVASGNLEDKMRKRLTTIQRFEICLGAARGLCYLHTGVVSADSATPGIVHGNIKLSKILLNSDADSLKFEAKVSSFGLSKIVPGKTQVLESSDEDNKPTKESDVYSFGVLLLIVLCGVSELVDTDDYQERHVSELVPKKMKQNLLRKTVHFDIRKEIKTEALETYAAIACQCVVENPDERPQMDRVVEELEKALRLQGGEVTYVQIPGSGGATDETVVEQEDAPADEDVNDFLAGDEVDDSGEDNGEKCAAEATNTESCNNDPETTKEILNTKTESNEEENNVKIPNEEDVDNEISKTDRETTEDQNIDDFDSDKKSMIIDEKKEDDQSMEITTISESSNSEKNIVEETTNTDGVPDQNHIEDAKNESSNDDQVTQRELLNDLDSINESNITETTKEAIDDLDSNKKSKINEENKENDDNIEISTISESGNGDTTNQESVSDQNHIEDAKNDHVTEKEILNDFNSINESNITVENEDDNKSTVDPETTKETIDDFDSNKKSKIVEENKENDENIQICTISESSNGDTTNQEVHVLKSDRGSFREANEDELDSLRIPFEKIKFGQQIDVRGYGTLFEGEFNHQQVALKRLNITNLGNIKPKLLSAILTISRFRKHPNLVALIGFCDENNTEIILVYEHVSGGNLADKMSKHLTTIQRHQICLGAARGLEYLHRDDESDDSNPSIIHGNIKLSKILLNSDSDSSYFEAKVSGFGLPKLLPGHVEIVPRSVDPVHAVTGKLTKESDVYSFGVLLLEVLCGVPELVDTDDYQERHVTELVPKRLEQNMLRKIVHFDIRDEITTESLETYAKIACRCVMKNPEERPTMSEVVVELEKALRLQGGEVSDVHIFGSSNGNGLPNVAVGKDDHESDDTGEMMISSITEEKSKGIKETSDDISLVEESFPVPVSSNNDDFESVLEDAETKTGIKMDDNESTEEIAINLHLNSEESNIIGENEVDNESKITTSSSKSVSGDNSNPASSNGNGLDEVPIDEDELDNGGQMRSNITEEESKVVEETTNDTALENAEMENDDNMNVPKSIEEITVDLKSNEELKIIRENEVNNESKINVSPSNSCMQEPLPDERSDTKVKSNGSMLSTQSPQIEQIVEVQNSVIPDGKGKADLSNTETSELIVNIREGDFSNSGFQIQKSETKRSNSTSSESSNGDDTSLLPKSPDNMKKASRGSRNCGCCLCSCWQFISDRVVLYGELFLDKLVSWFTWMTGQCSRKKD